MNKPLPTKGFSIEGKVVLITGANRGIGKALLEAFADNGAAKIYAAVRNLDSAQPLVEKYSGNNEVQVAALYMDLSKPETIKEAASKAPDVDIVINNAGILSYTSPFDEEAIPNLQEEMQVNVYGLVSVAQAFAPILKPKGCQAVLCQINSIGSLRSHPAVATYAASKAASYAMTQSIRTEFKPHGVRVLSVHPGPVDTDMIANNDSLQKKTVESPENVALRVLQSMERGEFLCFPDPLSKSLSEKYHPFAEHVFEQGNMY